MLFPAHIKDSCTGVSRLACDDMSPMATCVYGKCKCHAGFIETITMCKCPAGKTLNKGGDGCIDCEFAITDFLVTMYS